MQKIINVITNPKPYLIIIVRKLVHILPKRTYLKLIFYLSLGYKLNLNKPETFNEKLQWLKLNRKSDIDTLLVDKYEVKKILSKKFGGEYIIPTYGVYEKFDDIDFEELPNEFVMKTTHQSGGVIICRNKRLLDLKSAKAIINNKLKKNLYYWGLEWPYKNVKPRIIIEKYIGHGNEDVKDYKLMCFNGKVKCSFVCTERYSKGGLHINFYDNDWNLMPFTRHYPNDPQLTPKPLNYDLMVKLAEDIAKDIPFVRIDFYEVHNKLYFGEITFYPGCGFEEFNPQKWDKILGSWIKL